MDRWRRRKMVYRGKMLFFRKNYGPFQTVLLRIMFASLSLAKIAVWGGAYALPGKREIARKELRSNSDVLKVCWNLA
jgi:hypothetical protein